MTNQQRDQLSNQNPRQHPVSSFQLFAGPLPHPEILAQYNKAFPGAAKEIVEMAKRQESHRQGLEAKVVQSNITNERYGMIFAFIITVAFMITGAVLIALGRNIPAGYLALFGPAIFQAGSFAYKKINERPDIRRREAQPQQKRQEVEQG